MLWFDLDNSPHVPLFRPILAELDRRGIQYLVTARDHAQTVQLLRMWNIPHTVVGTHGGKSRVKKLLNLADRSRKLAQTVRPFPLRLAVSHGSRTQVVASWFRRLPSVVMLDYEYTEHVIFNTLATWLLVPAMIPDKRLREAGFNLRKVIRYSGFKEEIYLDGFDPLPSFRSSVGVSDASILVTIRPPSVTGNYHDHRSEELFRAAVRHFSLFPDVHILVTNRTGAESSLFDNVPAQNGKVDVLQKPVDGLQLLWHSDIVISGGGTMNREAALLGVPTYSIFTGKRPYLDELLQEEKKLQFINTPDEISAITPRRRPASQLPSRPTSKRLASEITDLINDLTKTK